MLIIPLKCTTRYDLREPLAKWLDGDSSSLQPTAANPLDLVTLKPDFTSHECRSELIRLASLRNCLADSIAKPYSHKVALEERALEDCHEYHAALLEFIKRGFPSSNSNDDTDGSSALLQLTWKACIGPQTESHGSLEWDRACIVWNIAALESYLGSIQSLETKEGCKLAVKHYQTAACMMRYLHDDIIPQQQQQQQQAFATVDLSLPCLKFYEHCMLAQAQGAAYQVAEYSSSPPSILSYLSMGAVPLWNDALKYSKDTLLVSQLPTPTREWSVYCKSQSMRQSIQAAYNQALACQQSQSWGLEIVWLRETQSQCKALNAFLDSSSSTNDSSSLQTEMRQLSTIVERRLQQALKDNQLIYGESIPPNVPTIAPKQLVKSEMDSLPETMTKPQVALFG